MAQHPLAPLLALRLLPRAAGDREAGPADRSARRRCDGAAAATPARRWDLACRRAALLAPARRVKPRGGVLGRLAWGRNRGRSVHAPVNIFVIGFGAREHDLDYSF